MLTLKDIKELQIKYNLRAKKRFGQNFLIDTNVLNNIIKTANIESKSVVEIGPGMGSLTTLLLDSCSDLIAFEIDKDMIKVLKGEIETNKFNLIEGDFLKQELEWEGKKVLIANLPYYITSDILFKVFYNIDKFERALIMIQDEVADRLTAPVGSKSYGKLTITANYFATIKKEFVVKPSSFSPQPNVNSAIISLDFNKENNLDTVEFLNFIKLSFKQRRKTLINNWKDFMDKEKITEILTKLDLSLNIRPQNLTLENFKSAFLLMK